MSLFNNIKSMFQRSEPAPIQEQVQVPIPVVNIAQLPTVKRFFTAADGGRLTSDWNLANKTSDAELRYTLEKMRSRSREKERNNPTIRKFLRLCEINIVGPQGVTLTNKATDLDGVTVDVVANKVIENAWWYWSQRGACDVTEQYSWVDLQRMIIRTVARDGEIFLRVLRHNNKHNFALQLLEADFVPVSLTQLLPNGNTVSMGIEYNIYNKPVAYYFLRNHPGADPLTTDSISSDVLRVDAKNVIHVFYRERPSQGRGIPWTSSVMFNLHQLEGFTQAEVIAARIGACQMASIETPTGVAQIGDGNDGGQQTMDMAPGMIKQLPAGWSMKNITPQHPNINHGQFVKDIKRDTAGGLGVSYNSLASDLEGVNYSSLRQGALEDRDNWKMLQDWFIGSCINTVFAKWIEVQLLMGTLIVYNRQGVPKTLDPLKADKYNSPVWHARSWQWVDPARDMAANISGLDKNLISMTKILGEQGIDIEEHFAEIQREKELMKQYGLVEEQSGMVGEDRPASVTISQEDKSNGKAKQQLQ